MKNTSFKTKDGKSHAIDRAGNHFIDGKCVNPEKTEGNIGDTYPDESEIVKPEKQ